MTSTPVAVRVVVGIAILFWVLSLGLVAYQAKLLEDSEVQVPGIDPAAFQTQRGVSLFSPKNTAISKSLGGWCTNCNAETPDGTRTAPCDSACMGNVPGRSGQSISAGLAVPKGMEDKAPTPADCAAACEADPECQAFEWDAQSGNCFKYTLSMYPPITPANALSENVVGWTANKDAEDNVLRDAASAFLVVIPAALAFYAYKVRGRADSTTLAWVLPLLIAIMSFGWLHLIGFTYSRPDVKFACNAGLGQKCFADAITEGKDSGTCYNNCCARTLTCKVDYTGLPDDVARAAGIEKSTWSTCTWPNVMCRDGHCAESAAACSAKHTRYIEGKKVTQDHGGLMPTCDQGVPYVKGRSPENGADYSPGSQQCNAQNIVRNASYPIAGGPPLAPVEGSNADAQRGPNSAPPAGVARQYPGQKTSTPPAAAVTATGRTTLPPGRVSNAVDDEGNLVYNTFSTNAAIESMMAQAPTSPNTRINGCGLATNPQDNTDALFLVPSPASLQCRVAPQ